MPPSSSGISILITSAPQSASWRTQVGPAGRRVKSSTWRRASAGLGGGRDIADSVGRLIGGAVSCTQISPFLPPDARFPPPRAQRGGEGSGVGGTFCLLVPA